MVNLSILILLCILNILIGLLRFYEKINWRIEPISMEKEIRNTEIMGVSLIVLTVLAVVYFFISNT